MALHRLRAAVVSGGIAAVLVLFWPAVGALGSHARAPHEWVADQGADRVLAVVAEAGLWVAAAWLALGILTTLVGRLPGWVGAAACALARVLVPRVVHRLLAGTAGLGVLLAPVASGAVPAQPGPAPTTSTAAAVPTPAWPLDPSTPSTSAPRTVPTPVWPLGHRDDSDNSDNGGHKSTPAPADPRPPASDARIRVRPGDSLWLIAARRLGPAASPARVAAEWPRWYAANRDVIGPDPSLIHPGQLLAAPAAAPSTEGR